MANLPIAFLEIIVGGVLTVSAVTNTSVGNTIRGNLSSNRGFGFNLANSSSSSNSGTSSPIPAGSGGQGSTVVGDVTTGDLQTIAQQHGWSQADVTAWGEVIKLESNGTLTDTNPTSGAYGIAQGITGPSWYADHGGDATTVMGQLTAMANYIAQRYGTPTAALSFHLANGWY